MATLQVEGPDGRVFEVKKPERQKKQTRPVPMPAVPRPPPQINVPEPKVIVQPPEPDLVARSSLKNIENTSREMQAAIEAMVAKMGDRSVDFNIEVTERDQNGNIKSITVRGR